MSRYQPSYFIEFTPHAEWLKLSTGKVSGYRWWGIGRSGLYPAGVAAEAAKIIEDQALDLIRATNEIISLERQLRSSHAPKDSSTDYGEGFEEGYKAGRVNMEAYPRI